jgi:hypothetical protein
MLAGGTYCPSVRGMCSTPLLLSQLKWQEAPIPANGVGVVVVGIEGEPAQLGCPCTHKLWEAAVSLPRPPSHEMRSSGRFIRYAMRPSSVRFKRSRGLPRA